MIREFIGGAMLVVFFLLFVQLIDLVVKDQLISTVIALSMARVAYYGSKEKNDDDPCL